MSLSKTIYPPLSTDSKQEDLSRHDSKIVYWEVKNQTKQNKKRRHNIIPDLDPNCN